MNLPSRIAKLVDQSSGQTECWPWRGYKNAGGYGRRFHNGRNVLAHRLVYALLCEEIPQGMVIDHLCRNRGCVNPAHLEVVTPLENQRRGLINGIAKRDHCANGHPYTPDNLRFYTNKGKTTRVCRACQRYHQSKARARRTPKEASDGSA